VLVTVQRITSRVVNLRRGKRFGQAAWVAWLSRASLDVVASVVAKGRSQKPEREGVLGIEQQVAYRLIRCRSGHRVTVRLWD
jgi:hypothetical protein